MNNIIRRFYSSKNFQNIRLISYKKTIVTTEKMEASYIMVNSWYNKNNHNNNNKQENNIKKLNPEYSQSNYKKNYDEELGVEFPSSRFN